jgi:Uncharacterized protein conserved in bacteria (DUF2188)
MTRKEVHIVPNIDKGGWDAKRENAERASKHFETKQEALDWGKAQTKNIGAEFIPHKLDGTIQNPNSFGSDPNPPKDKKH